MEKEQDIIIYQMPKGPVKLRAQTEKETMWATQEQIAKLFGVQRAAITKHVNNILRYRNPMKLYTRECSHGCGRTFSTTYAPDRPEKVYCDQCYQAEVL